MKKDLDNKKWSCRKVPYATSKIAKAKLKILKKKKGRNEVRVYYCEICDAYHLTKIKKNISYLFKK
jgi:hypothetical protein